MAGDPVIEEYEFENHRICLREAQTPELGDFFGDEKGEVYMFISVYEGKLKTFSLSEPNVRKFLNEGEWDPNARLTECRICWEKDEEVGVWDYPSYNFFVHKDCFSELCENIRAVYEEDTTEVLSKLI